MEIERKKDSRIFITERTPGYRDFAAKGKGLHRELIEYVKKTPPLNDMYEMNLARQREKVKKNEKN